MSCPKFYKCDACKVIIEVIAGKNETFECCGNVMTEMTSNTSEGAHEKHLPVIEISDNIVTVKVGTVLHPMLEEHSIEWIYLETKQGSQRKKLSPSQDPIAKFVITDDDAPVAAYAYCNLHGFWKTEIK